MSDPTPIVFVVDDDASVREALSGLIRSVGWSVETFDSAHQFLARAQARAPNCVVLDVRLPGLSGLDLQERMAERDEPVPIVFITGHGDIPMTVRAMKAGAVEFLTKPFLDQHLLDGVGRAIERDRARRHAQSELQQVKERYASLTPRERQVMELVVAGRLNKQSAAALGIKEITVKVHRASVMAKMGARSLPDLVRLVAKLSASDGAERS